MDALKKIFSYFLVCCVLFAAPISSGRSILTWMCLERCGKNVTYDLEQIHAHRDVLDDVSYEAFDLGANSTLIDNHFSRVTNNILQDNLGAYPMITTVRLNYLRELFSNPSPFIKAAVAKALELNVSGYNIDFEPTTTATSEDASNFAKFLGQFSDALHEHKMKLQVCVASWNIFWNFQEIAASSIDLVITMDTYATKFATFKKAVDFAVKNVGLKKLGIGLDNDDNKYSKSQLQQIFDKIVSVNANQVSFWDLPLSDDDWNAAKSWKSGK
jgi:hypothetical protein